MAKKEIFNKAGAFSGMIGSIKQFNDGTRNWFSVTKKSWTKTNYAFKKARLYQRMDKFYKAYKKRSTYSGAVPNRFILNVEEMATLYHFPMLTVKAPMVKRTGAKKSEPPPSLPVDGLEGALSISIPTRTEPPSEPEPASDLPEPGAEPDEAAAPEGVAFIEIPDVEPEVAPAEVDEVQAAGPPPNLPTA